MNLKPIEMKNIIHSAFGGSTLQKQDHTVYEITLQNVNRGFSFDIQVLDQPIMCGKIPRINKGIWEKELKGKNITLTDSGRGCPDIELLIGADFCGQLFSGNIWTLECGLVTYETKLGWLIMGKVPGLKQDTSADLVTSLLLKNSSVADLWKMETLGIMDPVETKSKEEMEKNAVEHFMKTIDSDEEGRYIVNLPWIEAKEIVQDNRSVAEQRCIRTSQKLKVEGKYTVYKVVFKEWLNEEVIEKLPKEEIGKSSYYLPHRGVFKKNSTAIVCPVFDASCRVKNVPSLNDCLEKGPNLIEQIPPLLMKFRLNAIGVIAHIRKAFLQISVAEEDQDYLRFLRWEDYEKKKFEIFQHRRLVFSPFILAAVLNYHLEETKKYFPDTSEKLKNSFYVNNCVTSVYDADELSHFIQEAKQLLAMACFDLRGWEHTL
ncbi:transposon Tf2-6 polyprotein [Trichonephila clavipes]|nr:transposon Tf2-6 polyprotein [Trichonephila clavipes]